MSLRPCCRRFSPLSWISRKPVVLMPLKAKIQSAAFSSATEPSEQDPSTLQEPKDDPDDVLFGTIYGARTIELNRPKKLNSLNGSMVRKIIPRLKEWQKSDMASVIIMAGAGEKAFCAGGDVAVLANYNRYGAAGQKLSTDFFALEYELDHLIATYRKPYIAYMDGITMGGGVGLSVHAPLRIATERTVFAMPETTIGFFPDVGGSFFLPRLDGEVGKYLALTSERLKGVNAFFSGIATHYLHSSSLQSLTQRLSELTFRDHDSLRTRLATINTTIEEFTTGLPHDENMLLAGDLRHAIDRCFKPNSAEDIIKSLEEEADHPASGSPAISDWAKRTLATLRERSPTSLKVTLRQMALGKRWTIRETFQREHQLAARFMAHRDFTEGVTARLIERRTPQWQPPSLNEVTDADVDSLFRTSGTALDLPKDADYSSDYPFADIIGLPREKDVRKAIEKHEISFDQQFYNGGDDTDAKAKRAQADVVQFFQRKRDFKLGVREKVFDIAQRKIGIKEETGEVIWIDEDQPVSDSR